MGSKEPSINNAVILNASEIESAMPHAHPFLFLQGAEIFEGGARGFYKVDGSEFFLKGHFKGNPVMPASVMIEALGQLGVLYLIKAKDENLPINADPDHIFFASCDGIRCSQICRPGDTLEFSIKITKLRKPICMIQGSADISGVRAVFAEKISLTFEV